MFAWWTIFRLLCSDDHRCTAQRREKSASRQIFQQVMNNVYDSTRIIIQDFYYSVYDNISTSDVTIFPLGWECNFRGSLVVAVSLCVESSSSSY
jgi:hypothetical protein